MRRTLAGILGATTILVVLGVTGGAAHAWDCSLPENWGVAECPFPSTTTTTEAPTTTTVTVPVTIPEVTTTTIVAPTSTTTSTLAATTSTTNPCDQFARGIERPHDARPGADACATGTTTTSTTKPVVMIGTAAQLPRTGINAWLLALGGVLVLAMGVFVLSLCQAAKRGDEWMFHGTLPPRGHSEGVDAIRDDLDRG